MTDVFISYSRRDKEFVQVLHTALKRSIYEAWIDWQDIEPTTDWWREIETGIEEAHTFIFVISKDSIESEYCQ
ncbi:MAG: toll/interleukin-1 receptor domain-containing protein, partial [Cyanobacteria bacterium J06627_8]